MYAHSVSDTVHLVPDRPLSLASVGGSRHFVNIETLPVPDYGGLTVVCTES